MTYAVRKKKKKDPPTADFTLVFSLFFFFVPLIRGEFLEFSPHFMCVTFNL